MRSEPRIEGFPMSGGVQCLIMHSEPRLKGFTKSGGVRGPNNAF